MKAQNTPKLYLSMYDLGNQAESFVKNNNIGYVRLVGGAYIDPDNDMIVNESLLRAQISKLFPNSNDSGIGILDWEGKAMNILSSASADDPKFLTALQQYQRAVRIGQTMRPNVRWAVYGLPFREYWNINSKWEERCMKLLPLLKMCDIITPSLYSLYPASVGKGYDEKYVSGNVQLALKIGLMIGKPVYPYIWHRLPDDSLIPKDQFLKHTGSILRQSYKGNKVAGLIWWGSDLYSLNVKAKPLLMEIGSKSNFTPYHDKWFIDYAGGLLNEMKNSN